MGNPLRILHAVVNMNRGGAETLIMNLYRNVDRSKVQFDFLTCKEGIFDDEILKMGGKVYRIPYLTDVGHFQYIKALDKFFFNNPHYKIVHSHMDKMSGFIVRAAQKSGVPVRISHSHNTSSEGGIAAKCYKWYAGHFIDQNATHLFACSAKASTWLFGNKGEAATIVKNGIECDKFKYSAEARGKAREQLKISKESFIIGHIGRFCRQKNHTFLIDIFSEVIQMNPDSYLIMAGDGPLKGNIERKIQTMGLEDHVKFLGVRSDVHHLLQAFDVMLFPSLHEGLPVTLIEAQGAGLPSVISDVITREVDLGAGLIKYENIKSSPQVWAEKALHFDRSLEDTTGFIKKMGYDIRSSANWLQNYYLNLLSERKSV